MRDLAALDITVRPAPSSGAPTVVLVHGSLDRGDSFRRVVRRLPELAVVTYDRRGYHRSRQGGVVGLATHVADLVAIGSIARGAGSRALVAVGHSFGGDVVIGAALERPELFDAVGAFEPPLPWLGFVSAERRLTPVLPVPDSGTSPETEAERFFGTTTGVPAWNRLSERARAERRSDGPALLADMRSFGPGDAPFDVTALNVPAVFAMGGAGSAPAHRDGVRWLSAHVAGAELVEIAAARHGAHLSHPDHFAALARRVVERGTPA
jgi:pimeloyl-ACP methyl ester carboxylesterase